MSHIESKSFVMSKLDSEENYSDKSNISIILARKLNHKMNKNVNQLYINNAGVSQPKTEKSGNFFVEHKNS